MKTVHVLKQTNVQRNDSATAKQHLISIFCEFYRKLETYMEWNYYRKEDCIVKKRLHCTAVKGASEYPRKGWRQS